MTRGSLLTISTFFLFISGCQPKGPAKVDNTKPQSAVSIVGDWQLVAKVCDGAEGSVSPLDRLLISEQGTSAIFVYPKEEDTSHRCMKIDYFYFLIMAASQANDSTQTTREMAGQLKLSAEGTKCWRLVNGSKAGEPYVDEAKTVEGEYRHAHFTEPDNNHLLLEAEATPFCGGRRSVLKFERRK